MTVRKANGEDEVTRRRSDDFIDIPENVVTTMSLTYSDFLYPQSQLTEVVEVPDYFGSSTLAESLNQQYFRGSSSNLSSHTTSSSYLPNEFQVIQDSPVPLLQTLEESDQDFIIIAEFSELEGPIPICTIPSTAPEKTDINLNSFAVHLMSTDYQVNTVGQFGVCEDTQVLRTNVFQGVHVAMQYFTLYDIKARGFVRPFCFGYVSKDSVKLDRILGQLIEGFNQITKVLKYTNRLWFASELTQFLEKLCTAKEEFIARSTPSTLDIYSDDVDVTDSDQSNSDDSESISLNQIAQQYSEIENILKTIKDALADPMYFQIATATSCYPPPSIGDESKLSTLFQKLDFLGDSFASLDIPLLHPLKQKAESLRPMTTLGQYGTVILVQELMRIYGANHRDLIFTEMDLLTEDFRTHFRMTCTENVDGGQEGTCSGTTYLAETTEDELCCILETIHKSVPLVAVDSKSGSYHSLSTDESDIASSPSQVNGDDISFRTAMGSVENLSTKFFRKKLEASPSSSASASGTTPGSSPLKNSPQLDDFLCHSDMNSSWTIVEPRKSISDGSPLLRMPPVVTEEPLEIQKVSWWSYAAKTKLQKSDRGYGLRKFWAHFPKVAHHLFYSILIGRPIILFGTSRMRGKVLQIINALVPFIPCFPSKSFKILQWHQGILVRDHLDGSFKLIGLCLPERLSIHDLLNSRDQNRVTLLDVEQKRIFGPAYSGNYLKSFEGGSCVQKRFWEDLSLLTFLGSILTEIETQVYMYKALQEKEDSGYKIMKELQIRNSDIEIIKHLSSLVTKLDEIVNLF